MSILLYFEAWLLAARTAAPAALRPLQCLASFLQFCGFFSIHKAKWAYSSWPSTGMPRCLLFA